LSERGCPALKFESMHAPAILTDQAAFKIPESWERVRSRLHIEITDAGLKTLEREVNQQAYALYGLTPEKIKIVEGAATEH